MSKRGFGKFLAGIGAGIGLGILFAPKSGTETRKDLKCKFDELLNQVKNLDIDEVKMEIEDKMESIKEELSDLDKEKVLAIAKDKTEKIKEELDDLYELAKEKATPVVEKAVNSLKQTAINTTKEILKKLEK